MSELPLYNREQNKYDYQLIVTTIHTTLLLAHMTTKKEHDYQLTLKKNKNMTISSHL